MRYSVTTTTDFDNAIWSKEIGCWYVKQSAVAYKGLCQVRAAADPFYGGEESRPFRSKVLLDPTWRQLFAIAKKQQQHTKDMHHNFFEGYYDTGREDLSVHQNNLPVRVIELALGS